MALTTLVAVSKLGFFRLKWTLGPLSKSLAISRSTEAPLGMRPEVGVLTVMLEPLLPCADSPAITTLPCASA
ncbi:hypothetical protein D3C71_1987350 [compost metagenome]